MTKADLIRDLLRAGLSRRKVTAMLRADGWFTGRTQGQSSAEVADVDRKRQIKFKEISQ